MVMVKVMTTITFTGQRSQLYTKEYALTSLDEYDRYKCTNKDRKGSVSVASIDISYECIIRRGNDLPKTVKNGIVGVIDCQGTWIRGNAGARKRRGHTVQIAVPFKLD